jgi:WD40 repeat protein
LKINPFGTHLATGDRNGNIRIYDLKNLESVVLIEAHESEILNLQYSQPESGYVYLASSGRDRLIHIFDSRRNYELVQTIDDQSAAITATRFSYNQHDKQFYLISCGYDKSIIIRMANEVSGDNNNNTRVQFQRTSYIVEKQTFYDLSVDPRRSYVNTISQDRVIRTYSIKDGKKQRQFKGKQKACKLNKQFCFFFSLWLVVVSSVSLFIETRCSKISCFIAVPCSSK